MKDPEKMSREELIGRVLSASVNQDCYSWDIRKLVDKLNYMHDNRWVRLGIWLGVVENQRIGKK